MISLSQRDEATRAASAAALKQHQLIYADESVVRFFARRFNSYLENQSRNAIDLGFGSGRHLRLMLDFGFQVWGTDYTVEAIKIVESSIGEHSRLRDLVLGDFRRQTFEIKFDAVLAWGSLFVSTPSEMHSSIKHIAAAMKTGGRIFLNFRTSENWFFGLGKEIEKGCFILDERAGPYSGMCYTFMDLQEVEHLVKSAGLSIAFVEKMTISKNYLSELHSWLQVELVADKT